MLLDNSRAKGASPGTPIRGTELPVLNNSPLFVFFHNLLVQLLNLLEKQFS